MLNDKILVGVVDDDESFNTAMGRMLQAAGFQVALYPSAEEFLSAAPVRSPDCLLLDVQLSGLSGLELCRLLAAQGRSTPVIFITALDEPAIRHEAEELGCVRFFRKPVPGRKVVQAINDAVRGNCHR